MRNWPKASRTGRSSAVPKSKVAWQRLPARRVTKLPDRSTRIIRAGHGANGRGFCLHDPGESLGPSVCAYRRFAKLI